MPGSNSGAKRASSSTASTSRTIASRSAVVELLRALRDAAARPRRGVRPAARAAPAAAGARCGRAPARGHRRTPRTERRRGRQRAARRIGTAGAARRSQSGTWWVGASDAAARRAARIATGGRFAPAQHRCLRRSLSSIASGFSALSTSSYQQPSGALVHAARRPRSPADRPRASSPHRAAGGTRSRPPRRRVARAAATGATSSALRPAHTIRSGVPGAAFATGRAEQARLASAPSAAWWCRRGSRSAPPAPWRRAPSSPAPRRARCPCRASPAVSPARSQATKPCSVGASCRS